MIRRRKSLPNRFEFLRNLYIYIYICNKSEYLSGGEKKVRENESARRFCGRVFSFLRDNRRNFRLERWFRRFHRRFTESNNLVREIERDFRNGSCADQKLQQRPCGFAFLSSRRKFTFSQPRFARCRFVVERIASFRLFPRAGWSGQKTPIGEKSIFTPASSLSRSSAESRLCLELLRAKKKKRFWLLRGQCFPTLRLLNVARNDL